MDYELNKFKRSTTTIFKEENIEDKYRELKLELFDIKMEKKELLKKYESLKKRYNSLSRQLNSALCEIKELKDERDNNNITIHTSYD